jgi:hypothetical protein
MGNEPWSLDEALQGPNALSWNDALKYKINQLEKLHTWSIIYRPTNKPVIPYTEVLWKKMNANDEVVSRCVQVIAGGHKQMYGVNYMESMCFDWEIHQVDVKSAYLNAKLNEKVYMIPP